MFCVMILFGPNSMSAANGKPTIWSPFFSAGNRAQHLGSLSLQTMPLKIANKKGGFEKKKKI